MNAERPFQHRELLYTRRDFLSRAGTGFGALALAYLLERDRLLAAPSEPLANPLSPKLAHFPAKAKRVIFLFMEGGPSHLDTFDYKPKLREFAGQRLPESFGPIITAMGEVDSPLLADHRQWKQHGQRYHQWETNRTPPSLADFLLSGTGSLGWALIFKTGDGSARQSSARWIV